MTSPLLVVRDLVVRFAMADGDQTAVDGVSFEIPEGRTVVLAGESGCGKTVTAHSIMRLLPTPPARIDGGEIEFEGENLLDLSSRQMRKLRGARMAIVFQDPMSSLNPVYTIGFQLLEAYRIHQRLSRAEARRRAVALLQRVGFPDPEERLGHYPHELSGGMRQRVMIAMALACRPALLIADEPTTALDLIAATQLMGLLGELRRELGMSLLLISHDLTLVADVADDIVVLYAGQVVETGPTAEVLTTPRHPYTRGLLQSVPPRRRRPRRRRPTPTRLPSITGTVPGPAERPAGCRFSNRCPEALEVCTRRAPELRRLTVPGGHAVAARCLLLDDAGELDPSHAPSSDPDASQEPT